MSYLTLDNISKRYGDSAGAFDVDLAIDKGEAVCLLGASGCGKTTLLRLIAGLSVPDTGRILLDGEDITRTPPETRDIGMVFQTWALFPHLTVRRNLEFGLEMRGVGAKERRERTGRMLEMVRLGALADRKPHQLSGGQQQRIALARALVINPRVLLLDEPMSSLDFNTRAELRLELRALQQELKVTAIHVTHDYSEALAVADRTVLMRAGRIVESGPTKALFATPSTRFGAGFLGLHNIVAGEARGGEVRLETGHVGRPTGLEGDAVDVLVGIDEWAIRVAFDGPFEGSEPTVVTAASAEHGYTRLVLAIGDAKDGLRARIPGFHDVPPGTPVHAGVDWSKAFIVRDV